MLKSTIIIAVATLLIGVGLGWVLFGGQKSHPETHEASEEQEVQTWTCSMHPQIRQPEYGQCPLCGMDLITVGDDESGSGKFAIKMSPTAMQLANIQTSIVSRELPTKEIRLQGKVKANEQNISSQTVHISGRIERLMVNFTGEYITKGQTIAYVYSPELVTTQQELFEAYKIKESNPILFEAAKEKLKNWKLTNRQIERILATGKVKREFPITSDISGTMTTKYVKLGDHVKEGTSLYEVTNLSKMWVLFDIYESDISLVKKGDEITFTIYSLPGKVFTEKISFIDPFIDHKSRVAKARITIDNPHQLLKPEMFASGVLTSTLKGSTPTITVPKSAVMWTGKRSIVYVKTPNESMVSFSLREVVLGASLGDSYIVEKGLNEGEEIATHGTFSIDGATQLAGQKSMMSMNGKIEKEPIKVNTFNQTYAVDKQFTKQLNKVWEAYLHLKEALTKTDFDSTILSAKQLNISIKQIDKSWLQGSALEEWEKDNKVLLLSVKEIIGNNDIEKIRKVFYPMSDQLYYTLKRFPSKKRKTYRQYCPMAFDNNGGYWLSDNKEIKNPYFGDMMLSCGEVVEEL